MENCDVVWISMEEEEEKQEDDSHQKIWYNYNFLKTAT